MDISKEMADYWSAAVKDFFKLGLKEALVPLASLNYATAKAIGQNLNASVEVRGSDYVFRQNPANKCMEED